MFLAQSFKSATLALIIAATAVPALASGHRIRVDISSSNFPRWDVNPNTGEPFETSRRKVKADNTVYHSAGRPSFVVLPVVALEGR